MNTTIIIAASVFTGVFLVMGDMKKAGICILVVGLTMILGGR